MSLSFAGPLLSIESCHLRPVAHRTLLEALSGNAPIEELAWIIACDEYPGLTYAHVDADLDEIAKPVRKLLATKATAREHAEVIRERLHEVLGLKGNEADYYDPRNSYVNEVVSRRIGIPITLAVVWIAIGTRLGVRVRGIGFPGHFLVRVGEDNDAVYVDPFFGGRILTEAALHNLAVKFLGRPKKLLPEHLSEVDSRSIVVRMLVNLKHAHERRLDHARALVVTDRLVDITESSTFRRDRGLHALALGANRAAIDDLEAYLADHRDPPDAQQVERAIQKARSKDRYLS